MLSDVSIISTVSTLKEQFNNLKKKIVLQSKRMKNQEKYTETIKTAGKEECQINSDN
jgi:hypothetical protein